MDAWRRIRNFLADRLDSIRKPGWPRRIVFLLLVVGVMFFPYPLSITGDFEIISLKPVMARTKIEGTISEVLVKLGDHVEAGQVVARILDVDLKLERGRVAAELAEGEAQFQLARKGFRNEEVAAARARVDAARAELTLRDANLKRNTALYRANDIPKATLDDSQNARVQAQRSLDMAVAEFGKLKAGFRQEEIAQAAAHVEQLKARLAATDQQLAWTEVKAPSAGYVITPDQQLQELRGALVARGAEVVEIVDGSQLVARIAIPEKEFGDIKFGQSVELRAFQYPDTTFRGTVDLIEARVEKSDQFASSIPVIARVRDADWNALRVHSRGRAKIDLGHTSLGYVLYRRVLRSVFVYVWSWY